METGTTWKPQRISAHIPPRAQIVSEEQSRNFLFFYFLLFTSIHLGVGGGFDVWMGTPTVYDNAQYKWERAKFCIPPEGASFYHL